MDMDMIMDISLQIALTAWLIYFPLSRLPIANVTWWLMPLGDQVIAIAVSVSFMVAFVSTITWIWL